MRQNGVAAKQSEAIQTFGVRDAVTLQHIAVFPVALGTMGLDVTAATLCKRPKSLKRRIGAGWNEARRHHGLHQCRGVSRVAPDVTDQIFRAAKSLIRRSVAVKIRTLVGIVHHYLAYQG